MPLRVFTAAASTSQSTVIDSTSSMRLHEPLVAQVAEHQQLGRGAERHQRDELALVDEDRQRPLGGNRDAAPLAELVEHLDLARQRRAGLGQARQRTRRSGRRRGAAGSPARTAHFFG